MTTQVKVQDFPSASSPVRTAAVIGSGVMGAAIAAHLANAGIRALLLDIVPAALTGEEQQAGLTLQHSEVRSRLARQAVGRMTSGAAQPAPLYDPAFAARITPGNLQDDLQQLSGVDWIIEAVAERLEVKQEVLQAIESVWQPGTMVSTNTSGISVQTMVEGCGELFRRHFAAAHFFNPPRYMKLVEIVPTDVTAPEITARLQHVCERQLGKGTVLAKDTPNFIANRIGTFGMLVTLAEMVRWQLSFEEVDAVTGPAMGRPKTATFRMLDMIGLDTLLHVVDNVRERSEDPAEQALFSRPVLLTQMVSHGYLGDKSGSGFYRKRKDAEGRTELMKLNPQTMAYDEPVRRVAHPLLEMLKTAEGGAAGKVKALLYTDPQERLAQFAWATLKRILLYAAAQLGRIADRISDIDRAMKWGFNWELGPFELWDALGAKKTLERMQQEGENVPSWVSDWLMHDNNSFYVRAGQPPQRMVYLNGAYRQLESPPDEISLAERVLDGYTVMGNAGASLIDLGDDVACLAFHSASNAIGGDILSMIHQSCAEVSANWRGLVLANEGRNFCVGANLMLLLMEAQSGEWEEVEAIIRHFQGSMALLKQLDRPVVAAPHRMTLGGGVEVCLPADRILFAPETYFGLVETGVGLIPAGGGCMEAAGRIAAAAVHGSELQPHLNAMFEAIAMAKVSTSGHDVARIGWLRPQDAVLRRQDARIAEAKRAVLELERGGCPPALPRAARRTRIAGREGAAVLQLGVQSLRRGGEISAHDALIASKLAHVLAGGDAPAGSEVSEAYLLDLECEAFLSLCGEPLTQARMQHMLAKGKPLRN